MELIDSIKLLYDHFISISNDFNLIIYYTFDFTSIISLCKVCYFNRYWCLLFIYELNRVNLLKFNPKFDEFIAKATVWTVMQ